MMRPLSWIAIVLLAAHAASGCRAGPAPSQPDASWQKAGAGLPLAQHGEILRLTRLHAEQLRTIGPRRLDLPLDDRWHAPDGVELRHGAGTLRVKAGEGRKILTLDTDIQAWRYNTLHVRMRTNKPGTLLVGWRSTADDEGLDTVALHRPLDPGDESREYRFQLRPNKELIWTAIIERILLVPNDAGGLSEIEAIWLGLDPAIPPSEITIRGKTLEALAYPGFEWRLTVPESARLDMHLAVLRRGVGSPGAVMRVKAYRANEVPAAALAAPEMTHLRPIPSMTVESFESIGGEVLFEEEIVPGSHLAHRYWVPRQVDLSGYAGQEVVLRFESTDSGESEDTLVLWGNPTVRSVQPRATTPVILISCDTLRADHVGCYGYHRDTTPNLDAFARDAVLFEQAIVPEPWTLSTHMSMLTGLYPIHHATTNVSNLSAGIPTLAERLTQEAAYLAAGFVGLRWWLNPERGFGRGFDVYVTPRSVDHGVLSIQDLQPRVKAWLRQHADENFFLFYHNYDIHTKFAGGGYPAPYWPDDESFLHFSRQLGPVPVFEHAGGEADEGQEFLIAHNTGLHTVGTEERAYLIALYDDCIRMVDDHLGRLFEELKALEVYDDALIIVTADHGESFGEHGEYMHGQVYEHCVHVPLLVKFPEGRFAGQRYGSQVAITSLYPTVLEVAGLPIQAGLDGESLLALLEGRAAPPSSIYAWSRIFDESFAIRNEPVKLIQDQLTGRAALYDLEQDPKERVNLMAQETARAQALQSDLEDFFFNPQEALYIRLAAGTEDHEFRVAVHTGSEEVIAQAQNTMDVGERMPSLDISPEGIVSATLPVLGYGFEQLSILIPEDDSHRVRIEVNSSGPWQLVVGDSLKAFENTHGWEVEVDELPKAWPESNDFDLDPEVPTVFLWYANRAGEQTAADELSAEARADLEALGYL